jgi:hypothetical protein
VNTIEDSDDDYMFFSGGSSMTPDRPSQEQLAAENETRTILFKKDDSTNKTILAIQEEIEDSKHRFRDMNGANGSKFTKEQMEHINLLNEKIEKHRLLSVMASPMFQTHDEDGICAAEDCGLDEAICCDGVPGTLNSFSANSGELTEEQKQEIFRNMIPVTSLGIAAANGGGYTTVEDFFPEPLVPFSF